MNKRRFGQRQVGEQEAGGHAKDSFADSIAGDDSPTRRSSGSMAIRRLSQTPQMGDDAQQKHRGRVGDFR